MLERFRAFWTGVFTPIGNLLLRLGVSPDAVTLVGTLGVSAGALVFFPQGELLIGVLVISAFVFSDLIDGYMARASGRTSRFGHPHKEVVERWQSSGATVLTTGHSGTITITTDGHDLSLKTFIQPQKAQNVF